MSDQIEGMGQDRVEAQRQRHTLAQLSQGQAEAQRQRHTLAHMTQEQAEAQRERHTLAHMNEEQAEAQRERHTLAHMTQEQAEAQRERHLVENLNLNALQRRHQADALRRSNFHPMGQEWDYDNRCEYCSALWLVADSSSSRKSCCKEGKWCTYGNGDEEFSPNGFPALKPLPPNLKQVAIQKCKFFSTPSSYYNNLFSLGVTGIDNGRPGVGYEVMNMDACVKLNGRTYHMYQNTSMTSCAVSNVICDGFGDHVQSLIEKGVGVNEANSIRAELNQHNRFHQSLNDIGQSLRNNQVPTVRTSLSIKAHEEEISILRNHNVERGHQTVYSFTLPNQEETKFLDNDSYEVEPLMYPLLHPCGERGWGTDVTTCDPKIYMMDYLKSRLLQPEPELLLLNWRGDAEELLVNRYQLMARLGQYWIMESFSRALDNQIKFQRSNQNYLSGGGVHPERQNDNGGASESGPTYLNDTVHGSPKHRKRKASEALELLRNNI